MKIVIPGPPIPQARMKVVKRGDFVSVYDPKAKEKENIRKHLKSLNISPFGINEETFSFQHPRVSFTFHMPIPKSIPKKEVYLYNTGLLKHDKKPDVDNLVKLYLDCLVGIALQGDQQVSLGPCIKLYHPQPKTIICISETARTVSPFELDYVHQDVLELCGQSFCAKDCPPDSYNLWHRALARFDQKNNPSGTNPPSGSLEAAHILMESAYKAYHSIEHSP